MTEENISDQSTTMEVTNTPVPTEAPSFADFVPESYKEKGWVGQHKDTESFFKSYEDNMNAARGNADIFPTEESTDEQRAEFYKKLGVPENAEGYELEGIGGDEDFKKGIQDLFHKSNLTPAMAKSMVTGINELVKPSEEFSEEKFQEAGVSMFGDKFEEVHGTVKTLLKQYGDQDSAEALQNLPNKELLGVMRVLENIRNAHISEDSINRDNASPTHAATNDEKRSKAVELQLSEAYNNQFHPNHDRVVEEVDKLYEGLSF